MARVTIVIEDGVDGKVHTVVTPSTEEMLKEIRQKDGRGVSPAKLYAIRACTAILKLSREGGTQDRIITQLPKIGDL